MKTSHLNLLLEFYSTSYKFTYFYRKTYVFPILQLINRAVQTEVASKAYFLKSSTVYCFCFLHGNFILPNHSVLRFVK